MGGSSDDADAPESGADKQGREAGPPACWLDLSVGETDAREPANEAREAMIDALEPTRCAAGPAREAHPPEAHDPASDPRARLREAVARARVLAAPTSLAEYRRRLRQTAASREDFHAFLASREGPRPIRAIVRDGATEPSYDPSDDGVDHRELQGRSLFRWLERRVARSPIDRETFAILLEHGLGDKTYKTIAAERGIPVSVLSSRIFEFQKKYVARYKRGRDRRVLLLLFFFGAALVAVLVWLFWRHDEPPHETVRPSMPSIVGGRATSASEALSHRAPGNAGRSRPR